MLSTSNDNRGCLATVEALTEHRTPNTEHQVLAARGAAIRVRRRCEWNRRVARPAMTTGPGLGRNSPATTGVGGILRGGPGSPFPRARMAVARTPAQLNATQRSRRSAILHSEPM